MWLHHKTISEGTASLVSVSCGAVTAAEMKEGGLCRQRKKKKNSGITCELPPIDSGYRGEIHAIISNVSNREQEILKNTRIGQLIIIPVVIADFVFEFGKSRGSGAFGSTGK